MSEPELNMCWECPRCGTQVGQAPGVTFKPPKCSWGHPATEMEQRAAERFGVPYEEER